MLNYKTIINMKLNCIEIIYIKLLIGWFLDIRLFVQ